GHVGIHADHHVTLKVPCHLAQLDVNLVANDSHKLNHTRGLTGGTRLAQSALQRLLDALARNRHQAKVVKLQDLRRRAIRLEHLFERLHNLGTVAAFVHVDKVDYDDAAKIAQPDLPHNLLDGINIGLDDRILKPRRLAHIFANINVDGDQRL